MRKTRIIRVFTGFRGKLKSIQENHGVKAAILLVKDHWFWPTYLTVVLLDRWVWPLYLFPSIRLQLRYDTHVWLLILVGYMLRVSSEKIRSK